MGYTDKADRKPTAAIFTLGCRVNTCESLSLADRLSERGFAVLPKNSNRIPDVVFVNTCAVTSESARKSGQIIRRCRQKYPDAYIMAAGCFCQTGKAVPEADAVIGTLDKDSLADLALEYVNSGKREKYISIPDVSGAKKCDAAVYGTPYISRAHIKIEDGCDSRCAYCIIPKLRGPVRSKSPELLLKEIADRVSEGSREIVLTGIETGSYGKDLKSTGLIDILEKADKIPGIYLIRLGSMDPFCFNDDFIERLAGLEHFEHHIHLSVQSGCSETLAAMKRKYNAEYLENRINKLYGTIPDLCLTADVIVGFPGETEEDFRTTAEFAKRVRFLHMHIFPYSEREGTEAVKMENGVPHSDRTRRAAELEKINEECKLSRLQSAVGTVQTVHFETKKGELNTGYTKSYMPVRLKSEKDLHGEIIGVKITGVNADFTLSAEL